MSRYRSCLSVALIAVPMPLSAQAADSRREEVVVTASRVATEADLIPYSVEVIPEPRLVGRESVADALGDVADIYVQAPGGRSGVSAIFLRGSDPNFTAVLLDGVPLNNPANTLGGSVNVSEISSAGIERIEVVTGPLSSLYGSGALSGAVNLVVPGGDEQHGLEGRLGTGTLEDHSAFLQWRGPLFSGYGASLSGTYEDAGDLPGNARFRTKAMTGKLAPLGRADAGRIIFRISDSEARLFPDSSGGPRLAVIRDLEERESRERLIGLSQPVHLGEAVRIDLSGSLFDRRDRTVSPGVAPSPTDPVGLPAGEDETRYWRGIGQAAARYDANGWQAVAGVETQREEARSAGQLVFFGMEIPSSFRGDRWTHSGFAEVSRTGSSLVLNAGARVDSVQDLGAHLTGRIGIRYMLPGSGFSVRATAGTGFKAPSFYALGNPFVGNPDLRPERSRAFEAGIQYAGMNSDGASLTVFHTRFANLIDFVPDPFPRLENRSVVISKGIAASARKTLGAGLAASGQLLYAETEDAETGERLFNRPRWRSSALLSWSPSANVELIGRHRYVGARRGFSVPTGVTNLPGYHGISLEAAYDVPEAFRLRLVLDNALDSDMEDAPGFFAPGRRMRLLVGTSF